ncbi:MAG: hypothetical protein KKA42_11600, partial [candidate division Zixibacteria bacterium]|nr:hypothetical protein [candidate division Zixibacteria bacterium]
MITQRTHPYWLGAMLCLVVLSGTSVTARSAPDREPRPPVALAEPPAYEVAAHNVGKIVLAVTNNGTFGDAYSGTGCGGNSGACNDVFTGETVASCEYPKGSNTKYLFAGALWVGAVVGRDTLVSVGATGWRGGQEFHPDVLPLGRMLYRSTINPAKSEYEGAISEQDFIAVYYDTCTNCPGIENDVIDLRGHHPLGIEVTQRSFAWSYAYAEDFVLMDFAIKNIGQDRLRDTYLGIYVDADIFPLAQGWEGSQDDLCGFLEKIPARYLPPSCAP